MDPTSRKVTSQFIQLLSKQIQIEAHRDSNDSPTLEQSYMLEFENDDAFFGTILDECEAIERAQQFAFHTIAAYTARRLSSLRGRHNETAPIYRLSFDVLGTIFKFAVAYDHYEPLGALAPLQLASVSRRWREVALGTPRLWSTINMISGSKTLFGIFLDRSKMVPLDVELRPGTNDPHPYPDSVRAPRQGRGTDPFQCTVRIFKVIPYHLPRLRSLLLQDIPGVDLKALRSPAPQLETLHCINIRTATNAPIKLFAGCAPSLRSIRLVSTPIVLESYVYSAHLTNLHLERMRYNAPIHHLLRAIKACSLLQELSLVYIDFSHDASSSQNGPMAISLPELRRIEIRGSAPGDLRLHRQHLSSTRQPEKPRIRSRPTPAACRGIYPSRKLRVPGQVGKTGADAVARLRSPTFCPLRCVVSSHLAAPLAAT
ncbi:hypothetical protein BOTBODRAFT_381809 [Botryobasidium botryosum FD-172 SS1]|uniref:Uncharacterized protein n=1 Tax=Botryobasidium botryosum (strain FD-172 SS1) TaxID=930990 RepID=A0A067MWE7_BOTB1|nr:hypothetical protein BOTBODRAFT_381809 [Botryobasidium botryosum FD-172 SS1]